MRKGDEVRILGPPTLAGRIGVVEIPRSMGEVGVRLYEKDPTIFWFLPSELKYADKDSK